MGTFVFTYDIVNVVEAIKSCQYEKKFCNIYALN